MKLTDIKRIMILDECGGTLAHPGFYQMMTKAKQLFDGQDAEFICVSPCKSLKDRVNEGDHNAISSAVEAAVIKEKPELLLIPATPVGEEVAPTLGIKLDTGVAAHCVDIKSNKDGRITYMVPAFGGKVIGEIFVPCLGETKCAIATVKVGTFEGTKETAGEYRVADYDEDALDFDRKEGFELIGREKTDSTATDITKANIVVCGGYGIGSAEYWNKLNQLAEKLGGAAGSTRPVIDAEWGSSEELMIGTSGKSIKPKVYVGFGISGAAHHLCGIQKSGVIINVNNDEKAESFQASDYTVTADAPKFIDVLIEAVK